LFLFDLRPLFLFDGLVVFLLRDDAFVQQKLQRAVVVSPCETGLREQEHGDQRYYSRKNLSHNYAAPECKRLHFPFPDLTCG